MVFILVVNYVVRVILQLIQLLPTHHSPALLVRIAHRDIRKKVRHYP